MRIALISDIHGNLLALETVLEDITRNRVDRVICLGDVGGGGPHPVEVLDRLQGLGYPTVMGNSDEWMLDPHPYERDDEDTHRMEAIDRWCAARLTDANREYIRTFQPVIELEAENGFSLRCFHGSPRSNHEIIRATTADEELSAMLDEQRATVMAGGHTHEQMVRRWRDSLLVNPGSVGLSFEPHLGRNPPWAEYAIISTVGDALAVELRRAPVDVAAIKEAILLSGMPHAEWWAADWR